ncbi:DUF2934 domain-containing protein [Pseudomonas sp. R2.Fl]|nr:DUF2934 domain-containing protein [Pseudomonas sp. R2.Fl]
MTDREQRIRERAYGIWQSEGGVHGLHDDHWRRAESELNAEEAEPDTGLPPEAPQAGTENQEASPAPKRKASRKPSPAETEGKVHMGHIPGDPVVR